MTPLAPRISHAKWIIYALIGIWWCAFGVSFLVRKQASERLKHLPDNCDPKEFTALETAIALSRFGNILGVLTWRITWDDFCLWRTQAFRFFHSS